VQLQAGRVFTLDLNPAPGDTRRVCLSHPEIMAAAQVRATLLLDDGKLRLRVTRKTR
jgi:pyruvate kinase